MVGSDSPVSELTLRFEASQQELATADEDDFGQTCVGGRVFIL